MIMQLNILHQLIDVVSFGRISVTFCCFKKSTYNFTTNFFFFQLISFAFMLIELNISNISEYNNVTQDRAQDRSIYCIFSGIWFLQQNFTLYSLLLQYQSVYLCFFIVVIPQRLFTQFGSSALTLSIERETKTEIKTSSDMHRK